MFEQVMQESRLAPSALKKMLLALPGLATVALLLALFFSSFALTEELAGLTVLAFLVAYPVALVVELGVVMFRYDNPAAERLRAVILVLAVGVATWFVALYAGLYLLPFRT